MQPDQCLRLRQEAETTPITLLLFRVGRRFLGPVMMMMTMMIVVIVMVTTKKKKKQPTVDGKGDDDSRRCDAAATVSKR
jgi:uncharacterized membrane protein